MNTNRELLELAARAAGFNDATWAAEQACISTMHLPGFRCFWNPLTDDGDALRLAVKLGLDVEMHGCKTIHPYASACDCERDIAEEEQPNDGDPYAATRRAIVRAAAEIGRSMK